MKYLSMLFDIFNALKVFFISEETKEIEKKKYKKYKKHIGLEYKCQYCKKHPYPLNYHEKGDCPE